MAWIIILKFSKYKSKKQAKFEEEYFPNINPNEILHGEMNRVILEKYETKFESFIVRVKQNISGIKVFGLCYEDNCIDLQLEKNKKELYFNFSPKILFIFDEEDRTYYFKYDNYSYEELEDEWIKLVIKHFH